MVAFFFLEATQSGDSKVYRLGLVWRVSPRVASMIGRLSNLL